MTGRPTGQPGFEDLGGEPAPGEDVAGQVLPAGYDGVLGVTSTAAGSRRARTADASTSVLLSRDIDVAVPTYGAVTLAPNGATCAVDPIGSAPAAGIAAGVVALLRSAYPDDNAAPDRRPADRQRQWLPGRAHVGDRRRACSSRSRPSPRSSPRTRAGDGRRHAARAAGVQVRVTAPEPEPDPLAGALDDARWWGLVGGGALVVALLARPLLAPPAHLTGRNDCAGRGGGPSGGG